MSNEIEQEMEEMEVVTGSNEDSKGSPRADPAATENKQEGQQGEEQVKTEEKAAPEEIGAGAENEPTGGEEDGEDPAEGDEHPVKQRIRQVIDQRNSYKVRAGALEEENARLQAELSAARQDTIDPADYDTTEEYEQAKAEQGPPAAAPDYAAAQAVNTIMDRAAAWSDKPKDFTDSISRQPEAGGAPFTPEMVRALAGEPNAAQVAYAMSRRPADVAALARADAKVQAATIHQIAIDMGASPGRNMGEIKPEPIRPLRGGDDGGDDFSIDAMDKRTTGRGNLW